MDEKRRYDYATLNTIKQLDAKLMFKKHGGDLEAISDVLAEFMDVSETLLIDPEAILPNHKSFLEKMSRLQEQLQKMYATTVLWDADNLVEAIKAGNAELTVERYEALKISNGHLIRRVYYAQCDEDGRLLHELPKADENSLLMDEELRRQEGCIGEPILIPMESLGEVAQMIADLKLDKASARVKNIITFNYEEGFNELLREMDEALEEFDFDRAEELVTKTVAYGENINKERSKPRPKRKRILAVDDVPDILTSIKGMLVELYDVCCVTNAVSAMRFLQVNAPDLILLDIELGETDGFALLADIRTLEGYEDIPVMFLTSHTTLDYIQRARDAGVQDFLRKPISAVELITRCAKRLAEDAPGTKEED